MNFISSVFRINRNVNCKLLCSFQIHKTSTQRGFHTGATLNDRLYLGRPKGVEFYRRIDKIDDRYILIYKSAIRYQFNIIKTVAITCVALCVPALLYGSLDYRNVLSSKKPHIVERQHSLYYGDMYVLTAGLLVLTYFVLRVIRQFPLRIYKCDKEYVAIISGCIPRINNKLYFKKGDVKENFKTLSYWREASYKVNNRRLLLIKNNFRRPEDLYLMMENTSKYMDSIKEDNVKKT